MNKEYIVGDTIEVPSGNAKIAPGSYRITGIGKEVFGTDPSKYKTLYQCTLGNRAVTINEADLHAEEAPVLEVVPEQPVEEVTGEHAEEPTEEEKAALMGERSSKYDQYLEEHPLTGNETKKEKNARIKAAEDFALAE